MVIVYENTIKSTIQHDVTHLDDMLKKAFCHGSTEWKEAKKHRSDAMAAVGNDAQRAS
ncbi:hypothetical protein JCM19055_4304 [Geomicrobium sp. JCM 19055]|nr:hypothetical protein JCM19055_4304 [Geomicrobium sp. JCM 19055]